MKSLRIGAAVALATAVPLAHASCGAAFCVVNTDWFTHTLAEPGLTADLRYEYIDLDQPRAGTDRVGVGQVPAHHDEVFTTNRNWIATFDWGLTPRWAMTLVLPYVDREHAHIHNHHGEKLHDAWSFSGAGDARVQARYVFGETQGPDAVSSWGTTFGVKLPTGSHDKRNAEGELAERSLQPGSGTTDAVVGLFWHSLAASGWSKYGRVLATLPMNTRDGYKPGEQVQVDVGTRYAVNDRLALMLQVNGVWKDRDSGPEAEPADSGQTAIFASPGISYAIRRDLQLYAFVQAALYQRVNGVQLTADWSALAGVSWRFR